MRIHIQTKPKTEIYQDPQVLSDKLRMSLGAFANSISEVQVFLDDQPKDNKAGPLALLKLSFLSGGKLILESRGDTLSQAANRVLLRVRPAVERAMIRRWEWDREPVSAPVSTP